MRDAIVLAFLSGVDESDQVGVYALIDKVIFEPADGALERIQIWGAFALAKDLSKGGRVSYREGNEVHEYFAPVRGFMYFAKPKDNAEAALKEWSDLKKIAASGEVVGFGARYSEKGRVRKSNERAEKPDRYTLNVGVVKMHAGHPEATRILSLPTPVSPAEGDEVPAGTVKLVARNSLRANAKYVFELEMMELRDVEQSPPIAAGEKETAWTPKRELKAGQKYAWRVWAVDAAWKGGVASAEFKAK